MINVKSKIILSKIFSDAAHEIFDCVESDKKKTLEDMVGRLQILSASYKSQSSDVNLKPRHRARARDYEQNANGLVNGILFAVATLYGEDSTNR
jgi:hypothetical protein